MKKLLVLVVRFCVLAARFSADLAPAMWLHDVYTSFEAPRSSVLASLRESSIPMQEIYSTQDEDIGIQVLLVESALTWDEPLKSRGFHLRIGGSLAGALQYTGLQPTRRTPGG